MPKFDSIKEVAQFISEHSGHRISTALEEMLVENNMGCSHTLASFNEEFDFQAAVERSFLNMLLDSVRKKC